MALLGLNVDRFDGEYSLSVELNRDIHPSDPVLFVRVDHGHQAWRLTLRLRRGQWYTAASVEEQRGRLGAPAAQVVAHVDAYTIPVGALWAPNVPALERELVA